MDSVSQGEKEFFIKGEEYSTSAVILVLPRVEKLAEKRCRFIVEKQQYFRGGSLLDGAFLTYDNEDKRLVYEKEYDHNGGRERVGMGALLALWLQKNKDMKVEKHCRNIPNTYTESSTMRIQVLYTMMQEEIIPGTVCTIIHGLQFFYGKIQIV